MLRKLKTAQGKAHPLQVHMIYYQYTDRIAEFFCGTEMNN